MTLVRLGLQHAERIEELENICFSVPWSWKMITDELSGGIGFYVGAVEEGLLIGYAGMQVIVDEGYITNVAVDPAYRRRGTADKLIVSLIREAKERCLSFLTLEVRQSNLPAQKLYEKHGFRAVGLRKGYYYKPKEDAVIMTLTLL